MNRIGAKVFFDISNGNIVLHKGEMQGGVVEETIEEIIRKFTVLSERNRDTFDVLELEYGAHAQDFAEASGYRVNPETKTLEFSYPDPNQPEAPPVYVQPLTEQIAEKDDQIEELKALVTQISEDLAAFMDYQLAKEENGGV